MSPTWAVFGGSFDPPHIAHTLAASYVLSVEAIDRLIVVPTSQHPLNKSLCAAFSHRRRMCELAMRHLQHVEVSSIEHELGGASLTLRTLQALQARSPGARLRLVIGSDLLPETRSWHAFDQVMALATPLVVPRAGATGAPRQPALPAISSTEIRRRLRDGESTTGLLDPQVAAYIDQQGLYRD